MKRLIIIIACIIFFSASTYSQVNTGSKRIKPTKGYYSIYQNDKKLGDSTIAVNTSAEVNINRANKGYYSIGNNSNKLKMEQGVQPKQKRYAVSKGYYSIGKNSEKLN